MADRVEILIQKRTSLKSQITTLSNLIDKGNTDNNALKLRIARVTELYHAYEDQNDELAVLDSNEAHQTEFINIQERFYNLANRIDNIINAQNLSRANTTASDSGVQGSNAETITSTRRRIKLPEASLPTFDGKFENWLSFKNTFCNMIGSQPDLSDVDKLHYLKSTLTGDAASKIKIFTIDGVNYSRAWELLERSYEVKRILISKHLSAILNMPALEKESTNGLSSLADDTQQHIASLRALGVTVGSEVIVHLIETKLPKNTLEKWEITLSRDEFPKLDDMYEFLYKTAVCASKRERTRSLEAQGTTHEHPNKRKKVYVTNKAFVLNAAHNCIACKVKRHPLFLCERFKQLTVSKRIELVRNAKICYNCLKSHKERPCKYSNCTICNKRHNTLLHLEGYSATATAVTKPEVINTGDSQSA